MEGNVMLICLEEIRLRIRSNGCTFRRFWFCKARKISWPALRSVILLRGLCWMELFNVFRFMIVTCRQYYCCWGRGFESSPLCWFLYAFVIGGIFHTRPDRSWGPPSLLYNGSLPVVKWPECVDHPPPSSVEVAERMELYLYSPFGSSWSVLGRT